jgi:tetratricopeptide (TPR) repeat protein
MANSNSDQDRGGFEHIAPTEVHLSVSERGATPSMAPLKRRRPWLLWAGLLTLALAVGAVMFVLPDHVSLPAVATASTSPAAAIAAPAPQSGTPPAEAASGQSPFSRAQQEQARRESQEILQKLLDVQQQLHTMHVKSWAAADYGRALKLAKSGDDAYQSQRYRQAKSFYAKAVAALQSLVQRAGQEYRQSLQRGALALAGGDSRAAAAAFKRALQIRPNDAAAAHGLKRADSLDQVVTLIAAGDKQRDSGKLDEARGAYRQASDLDPDDMEAKQRLQDINGRIVDRDFAADMSRGFDALQAGNPDEAKRQFEAASRLKPGASATRDALAQAQDKITSERIGKLMDLAARQAKSEDWHSALHTYNAVLKMDPTLVAAMQGRARAEKRAALDLRLVRTIARPDRLSDRKVQDGAAALLLTALAVRDPGSRLKQQIVTLGGMLKDAVKPVGVTFQSDDATRVTLYHVGVMGSFDQREMSLRPGHYVAVGSRPGYRDVRVEFDVYAGGTPPPIVVQCRDKISLED